VSRELGRQVIDRTGLTGKYDFTLTWQPFSTERGAVDVSPDSMRPTNLDSAGPSIFTAIQEQLGLKLKPTVGPVEVLVVDHIERPSEN
jgi:uncharacterized protein (TIGR03435 family)